MTRYLLVGNPTAQSGKAADRIERALGRMVARGMPAEFMATLPGGQTVTVLKERLNAGGLDAVIYLGGDGTFAEVAKGVLAAESLLPMGLMPSGTANDQGKSFGISARPEALDRNLDVIDAGHTIQLDVGHIERLDARGQPHEADLFFDSAGFGLQSDILATRNEDRDRVQRIPLLREIYRDYAVYAGATLKRYLASYVEPTKFDAEIIADGQRHTYRGLTDLIFKGTAVYGGNWVPAPDGRPDDGMFEMIPMQGRRDMVSKMIRDHVDVQLRGDELESLGVLHAEGCAAGRFEVELFRPAREQIRAQLDGDEWVDGTRFRIQVLKQRLPLIVPARWQPPWRRT